MLKKLSQSAFIILMTSLSLNVQAVEPQASQVEATKIDNTNPYLMIEAVATKTFARFDRDKALVKADPDYLKVIVTDELVPYIDYKYAAYKVLGQYLRDTTKEQRENFVDVFKRYLIATYAQAFTEYTNQKVEFAPAQDFSGERIVDVNVQIVEVGRPPIKLQFKVRRLKSGDWKAFDLVAEGVSLLSSKQAEITNLIRQKGIDEVITTLEQHIAANDIDLQEQKKS